jgi:hypothetical protein
MFHSMMCVMPPLSFFNIDLIHDVMSPMHFMDPIHRPLMPPLSVGHHHRFDLCDAAHPNATSKSGKIA